ncbi:hypothetical protein I5U80_16045 [Stenotrophomonas maltophilia]|nr:hypothetical protein [Stenotrophomonas maltophilia]
MMHVLDHRAIGMHRIERRPGRDHLQRKDDFSAGRHQPVVIGPNIVDQQCPRGRSERRQCRLAALDQQERTDHRQTQTGLRKREPGIGHHALQLLVERHAALQLTGGHEHPDQHARRALAGRITAVAPEMIEVAVYVHGRSSGPVTTHYRQPRAAR